MSSSHFKYELRWCYGCAAEKQLIRLSSGFPCSDCGSLNDGSHPAEKLPGVVALYGEMCAEQSKNINRQRIFPQSPHSESHWSTAVSSRSTKLKIFRRSKHTSV